ncbi:ABC transporter substrate-binding protein [Pseudonocardia adelaidensis]|uniref:Glutathione ABC transporter substrate-binding protein GsiB n=1 Tax=Pseudonocardia adelaidensis TaxID=648754 RepID=A0ABP9NIX4_9PSEU
MFTSGSTTPTGTGHPPVRRRPLWAAALAAALIAAAACGTAGPGIDEAPTALDTSQPFGGDPSTEGTPATGGILRVGMYTEARSFDPTIGSNLIASAVYDSLLKLDQRGEPQPYLAESMTTPDEGTTWLLTLRPGVTFHDGTPLDADAVIFNVSRQRDRPTALGNLYTEPIAGMRAVDPLTVEFTLKRPTGSFPMSFALPFSSGNLGAIASPAAVQKWGADYGRHPVGAGPFAFDEWIPNNKIVVKRFDRYWQQGKPYLDGIEFRPLPDTETRYASVANGDIDLDIAGFHTEVHRSSQNPQLETYYGPGGDGEFLYFNFTRPPFDDPRMREAVIRAIDPAALSATQYRGAMDGATTAFAEGDPLYSAEAAQAYPSYDPERARQLIAEYRASGGDPNFTFQDANSPNNVQYATFLQAQWAAVGLDVKLQLDDIATVVTQIVQGGNFQMLHWISGPYENAYPFMYNQFHTGGINNYGDYSDPQVDAALDEAASTTDPARRTAAYQRAQLLLNQDLAVVWLARAAKAAIARPNVRGVSRYLSSELFWGGTWLAP